MRSVYILGGGGHAGVLLDTLTLGGVSVAGIIAPEAPSAVTLRGTPWLGPDSALSGYNPNEISLVNGIGSAGDTALRHRAYLAHRADDFTFLDVIHPSAVYSRTATAHGAGLQLLAGAVVGPGAQLGENVLINTRAVVEHDCFVGAHTHVATGAVLCGTCRIGIGVHIGAGAVVRQGISIGDGACIAAGAIVIRDVEPHTTVAGVPAAVIRKRKS